MSKQSSDTLSGEISFGRGYAVSDNTPDFICGRLFEILDAMGMQGEQKEAVKRLFRDAVWKGFESNPNLSPETFTKLFSEWQKKKEENYKNNTPLCIEI